MGLGVVESENGVYDVISVLGCTALLIETGDYDG